MSGLSNEVYEVAVASPAAPASPDSPATGPSCRSASTEPQHFSLPSLRARVARIRVLSRHGAPGDADYTALGAFALGAATGDPGPLLSG